MQDTFRTKIQVPSHVKQIARYLTDGKQNHFCVDFQILYDWFIFLKE
jgi:hypothetical protein